MMQFLIHEKAGTMIKLFAVAAGGAAGSICRYLIALSVAKSLPCNFPVGTFLANTAGCFLIGVCWGLFDRTMISNEFRLFIFTGFLGGFTTFSTFSRETAQLLKANETLHAAGYLVLSNAAGILLVLLGFYLANRIPRY